MKISINWINKETAMKPQIFQQHQAKIKISCNNTNKSKS